MKRIIALLLLLLIAAFLLYCANLDGLVHIRALALNKCEFCEFMKEHDLEADLQDFPQNEIGSMKDISYELILNEKLIFGHGRVARRTLKYNVPMNYCPECGRVIR